MKSLKSIALLILLALSLSTLQAGDAYSWRVHGTVIGSGGSDATPSAYRTTTQTMIAGRNTNSANSVIPPLSAEFSISIWVRFASFSGDGFVFNFADPAAPSGTQALGGGTFQALTLYWSGTSSPTVSDNNRLYVTGVDKNGVGLSASLLSMGLYGSGFGNRTVETLLNSASNDTAPAILLTVQVRSGNVELWSTYRGMRPRLLIQQPATWAGTSSPFAVSFGAATAGISGSPPIEMEMPIVVPDRSLAENDIAQLADGISPEDLNAASAKASASIKFASITNGGTTASDTITAGSFSDGQTITLNGTVYTFRTTPVGGNDVQISTLSATIDALITKLSALTPNTGGASNATYLRYSTDTLIITSGTVGGTSFTFSTTATAQMPANQRLALAWVYITDYTGYHVAMLGATGAFRHRAAAWIVPTGGALAPNTQVTGSMRITSWTHGMVVQEKAGVGNLQLDGIYTGVIPAGLQLFVGDQSDHSTVLAFTTATSFSVNTTLKTWTAKVSGQVPKGKRWLELQTRKLGSSQVTELSELKWGVGEMIALEGRSLVQAMISNYSTATITPNGFSSIFVGTGSVNLYFAYPPDNTWHHPVVSTQIGQGHATLANKISNDGNTVVGVTSQAIGGTVFSTLTTPAIWARRVADVSHSFTDTSLGPPLGWFIWVHENEQPYYPLLTTLYSMINTYYGSETKFGIVVNTNMKDSADNTMLENNVPNDQRRWLLDNASDPRIVYLGDLRDFYSNTTDGVHPTQNDDIAIQGEVWALSILKNQGIASFSGVGPQPVSATRSGANIDVTFSLNGATSLQVVNSGALIGGFDVALASNNFTAITNYVGLDFTTSKIAWAGGGNPLNNGDPVILTSTGVSIPQITGGLTYFVINSTASDFQISPTVGGSAVTFTSNGSGYHASSNRDLLAKTSVSILNPTTVRIVLAAVPSGPVAVNVNWGRPGRQFGFGIDPSFAVDPAARSAMTAHWSEAQTNILCDNFPLAFAIPLHTPGRPASQTVVPLVSN